MSEWISDILDADPLHLHLHICIFCIISAEVSLSGSPLPLRVHGLYEMFSARRPSLLYIGRTMYLGIPVSCAQFNVLRSSCVVCYEGRIMLILGALLCEILHISGRDIASCTLRVS